MAKVNSMDWMWEGREAYLKGLRREDCPYDAGSEPYDKWMEGFEKEAVLDTWNGYD